MEAEGGGGGGVVGEVGAGGQGGGRGGGGGEGGGAWDGERGKDSVPVAGDGRGVQPLLRRGAGGPRAGAI